MTTSKPGAPQPALIAAAQSLQTDPAQAEAQARNILKAQPASNEANLVLAVALRLQGKTGDALALLAKLSDANPGWPMVQYEIGLALSQDGAWPAALAALRRSAEMEPALPGVWRAIGDALYELKQFAEADHAYERFVTKAPNDPLLQEAVSALEGGRADIAEDRARLRLKHQPTDIIAMRILADVCGHTGRAEEAEKLLAGCVERAPGYLPAQLEYAQLLSRRHKFREAVESVDIFLNRAPDHPEALALKAFALGSLGEYEAAIALWQRMQAMAPDNSTVLLRLGHLLRVTGKRDAAIDAYNRIIARDPINGEAYWALANMKNYAFTDFEAEAMAVALDRPDLTPESRVAFRFALGRALDEAGRYEEAFQSYAAGNALKRLEADYDADNTEAIVTRSIHILTRDFFSERVTAGAEASDPIFVVGMPRAGSTLVEQILASHSQVEGTAELPQIIAMAGEIVGPRGDAGYPQALQDLPHTEFARLGEDYLARTRAYRKLGRAHFIDKMPNNFLHTGLIHLMLPQAKIVDVRRHPLACGFSNFVQLYGNGQEFSYRLSDMGRYYRDYVRLMAHYDAVLPGRVHRLVYENLLADPDKEIRALLAYCGLPFEEACLKPHENTRAVLTSSSEQVRQPIGAGDADHWRHYEAWLGPLKSALGPVLEAYPAVPESF